MKLLLFIVLGIGFCVEELCCMKRTYEETSQQYSSSSDAEPEHVVDPIPRANGTKRKKAAIKNKDTKQKSQKLPKKRQKAVLSQGQTTPLIEALRQKNKELALKIINSENSQIDEKDSFNNTALTYAVEIGDSELVKTIYSKSSEIKEWIISQALIVACVCGHKEIAQFLIEQGADVDYAAKGAFLTSISSIVEDDSTLKRFFVSPLIGAAYFGHTTLIEVLLQNKADINSHTTGYRLPLTAALEGGHDDTVQFLLERGALWHSKKSQVRAPLVIAAKHNRERWVKEFLSHVNNRNQHSIAEAFVEAVRQEHTNLIPLLLPYITDELLYSCKSKFLQKNAAPLTALAELDRSDLLDLLCEKALDKKKAYTCALLGAASRNNLTLAKKLLGLGAKVYLDQAGSRTYNALEIAIKAGHKDMVELLLQTNLCNQAVIHCSYALRKAEKRGYKEIVKLVEEAQVKQEKQQTEFVEASAQGDYSLVQQLLKQNMIINVRDERYRSPLIVAAAGGHADIVKLLLENKEEIPSDVKKSALDKAVHNGHTEVVRLLLTEWADKDSGLNLLLWYAVQKGHTDISKLLLDKGASPFVSTNNSDVLTIAKTKGYSTIEKLLEDKVNQMKDVDEAFIQACAKADIPLIKYYFTQDRHCDVTDKQGKTVLEYAIEGGNIDVITLLLEHDNFHSFYLSQALEYAAKQNNESLVEFIVSKCDSNKLKQLDLRRAIQHAAAWGNEILVTKFMKISNKKQSEQIEIHAHALRGAISKNNVSLVKRMINDKKKVWQLLYTSEHAENNPLFMATDAGSLELVQFFLEKGCPHTMHSSEGDVNALIFAGDGGNLDVIRLLLEKGLAIDLKTSKGQSALSQAARVGHKEAVQLLLQKGAKNSDGDALYAAVSEGHEEIVLMLIQAHETRQQALDAALDYAVRLKKSSFLIKTLLAQGARSDRTITAADPQRKVPLLMKALEDTSWEIVEALLDAGAQPAGKDSAGQDCFALAKKIGCEERFTSLVEITGQRKMDRQKAFFEAAVQGDISKVRTLLQGVNILAASEQGKTGLMHAIESGNKELIELLLKAGSFVNNRTKNGSCLDVAVRTGNIEIVKVLLDAGASIDRITIGTAVKEEHEEMIKLLINRSAHTQEARNNATLFAAHLGKLKLLQLFLAQGGSVNDQTLRDKRTPLMLAAEKGHEACVKTLLEAGADVTLQDAHNYTALFYAKKNGHETIVHMLEEMLSGKYQKQQALLEAAARGDATAVEDLIRQGTDRNAQDAQKRTSLMRAVINEHIPVVELLLKYGVDINLWDRKSETALSLAAKKADETLVKLLLTASDKIAESTLQAAIRVAAFRGIHKVVPLLVDVHLNRQFALSLALHEAIKGKQKALIEQLITLGADVNDIVEDRTSLMTAVCGNAPDIIKILLSHGALITKKNPVNYTVFDYAVRICALESFALLAGSKDMSTEFLNLESLKTKLQHELGKLLMNSRAQGPNNFMQSLAKERHEELLFLIKLLDTGELQSYLIEKEQLCADYLKTYKEGKRTRNLLLQTPLMLACIFGHAKVVRQFIESDMPQWFINAQDIYGRTALHYAILYGHTECVQILLKWYMQDSERIAELYKDDLEAQKKALALSGINLSDTQGNTALFYAVTKGNLNLINDLLKANARLSTDKRKAALALKIAAAQGRSDIVIRILFKLKDLPAIFK